VNLLSELLPGARQLRAPLATGFLWLLVAWINAPSLPAHIRHSLLVDRVVKDASELTPVLLVLAISFAAYLLGLLFEPIDEAVVKIVALIIPVAFIMVLAFIVVGLWPITLPVAIVITIFSIWRRRHQKNLIGPELMQPLISVSIYLLEYLNALWRSTLRVWSSAKLERDKLASEKVAELLDRNPDIRTRFCDTLSFYSLRIACEVAGLHSGNGYVTTQDGRHVNVQSAAARSLVDKGNQEILRIYLRERLQTSQEITREVALRVMHINDVRSLVDRALEATETWLRSEKSDLFDNCDRLRSEGNFLRAVTVPLALALCSIWSNYITDLAYVWLPAIPASLLYFSGLKKIEEAKAIVVGCVRIGIAPITLDISDTRLLSWPAPQQAINPTPRPTLLRAIWSIRRKLQLRHHENQ
jgi:hypothetical protein